jgi:hypothetical protein
VEAGSVLGLPSVRASFLVNLSAAEPREGEGGPGPGVVTGGPWHAASQTAGLALEDEPDDLDDFDDDDFDDFDEEDDEDDESEEEDDDTETWQVSATRGSRERQSP